MIRPEQGYGYLVYAGSDLSSHLENPKNTHICPTNASLNQTTVFEMPVLGQSKSDGMQRGATQCQKQMQQPSKPAVQSSKLIT